MNIYIHTYIDMYIILIHINLEKKQNNKINRGCYFISYIILVP